MDIQSVNRKIAELKREKSRYRCNSAEARVLRECVDMMIQIFEGIRKNMVRAAEEADNLLNEMRQQNAEQCKFHKDKSLTH